MAKREKGKLSGLKADGKPNAYWRKFIQRLSDHDSLPVEEWKEEQFLGYIVKRYKDVENVDFTFSFSGSPSRCKEIYCIRRMLSILNIDDSTKVKQYIDWVYDENIIPKKYSITSIGFFFTTNLILRFKQEMRKRNKITRATELPNNIQTLVKNLSLDVKTYGDLAFAKIAIEDDPNNEDLQIFSNLFFELKNQGFDNNILNNLE